MIKVEEELSCGLAKAQVRAKAKIERIGKHRAMRNIEFPRKNVIAECSIPHLYNNEEHGGRGRLSKISFRGCRESFLCQFFSAGFACENKVRPFGADLRKAHGLAR